MKKVGIVTDSTADIPEEYVDKYDIKVVPLNVFFGAEEFKDGVNLKADEFYEMLKTSDHHPKTSQPSPLEFSEVYNEMVEKYDSIISIHISSKLSGTYQSAEIAKNDIIEDNKNINIKVVDSEYASMGLGLAAIEASKMALRGDDIEAIITKLKTIFESMKAYFVVDTLKYLKKGGRIGKANAFLGNLLKIKPMLGLENGEVVPIEKIRGKSKVISKLIEKIDKNVKDRNKPINISIFHAQSEENVEAIKTIILKQFNVNELIISKLGSVIGTYVGPGTIGIVFYELQV